MNTRPDVTPRVLLYSHDSFGLGHFRRSSSIARAIALACPGASLLCVTGSPRPDLFPLPAGADYVKLPSVTKDDHGQYVPLSLDHRLDSVVQLRADTILTVARSYAPDIILVDHTPVGMGGELLPMLEDQRGRGDEVRIVLGMRDILDSPDRARLELAKPSVSHALLSFYDEILVYGHQHVCDLAQEYQLDARLAQRLSYMGVACGADDPDVGLPAPSVDRVPHVVVTAGGGADGIDLLEPTVSALVRGWTPNEIRATVITGPLLDPSMHENLEARASRAPHVRLIASTSKIHDLLEDADLVMTMGGYNSIYEALCMQRRVLALPRTRPRREQFDRVRRLAELGLISALGPDDMQSPETLNTRIREALASPIRDARESGLNFDGARHAAERLVDLAEEVAGSGQTNATIPRERLA